MSKFGEAAVRATELCRSAGIDPVNAWENAVKEIFPNSVSSQEKGCPRGAYLGLCEEGLVHDVPYGDYTRSKLNKDYAVVAIHILKEEPRLAQNIDALWHKVLETLDEPCKTPNEQMDVVVALRQNGDIIPPT